MNNKYFHALSLIRYFDSVDICKVRPDWRETRVEGTFPANAREVFKMVKLTVFYTTEVEVGVFQEGVRYVWVNKSMDHCALIQSSVSVLNSEHVFVIWIFYVLMQHL